MSRDLISRVTDRVAEELAAWQSRPLDRIYPVVQIYVIFVNIREGQVANRPIYVALGINCHGERDVLGLWAGTGGEGAKAWMATLAELRRRGWEFANETGSAGGSLPGRAGPSVVYQSAGQYQRRHNRRDGLGYGPRLSVTSSPPPAGHVGGTDLI